MSVDVAKLQIRIESMEAALAEKRLKGLENQGGRTERSTDGLTASFHKLVGPIAAVVSVSAGLSKLVDSARQFSVLSAGLKTATGSADGAAESFEVLEAFAESTPYALEQSVEAFTKLVNLGLTPSERAMRSYGNTSAAMGKDMTQMIEAVADASTFEFERLKEFGIKSRQEGDNVSFTFRGMTTTVKKEASEIEGYLIALGENNFSTAMEDRMNSFDGLLSNLGDSWDQLFRNINDQGIGTAMSDAVRLGIDALSELNAMLRSGELEAYFGVIKGKFSAYGEDFANILAIINELYSDFTEGLSGKSRILGDDIADGFKNLPENVRAFIQLMTVEIASFIDKTAAYGREILENLTFWEDETFDLEAALRVIDGVRLSSIETILLEREAAVSSTEAQIKEVEDLRAKYDAMIEAKKKASEGTDRLEKFGVDTPDVIQDGQSGQSSAEEKQGNKYEKELQRLDDFLATKEERLQEDYDQRIERLAEWEEAGVINEIEQYGYILTLEEKFQLDKLKIQDDAAKKSLSIERKVFDGKVGAALAATNGVYAILKASGKKNEEEAKIAGRVSIAASTAIGIMNAYRIPDPFTANAQALAVGLTGVAQLINLNTSSIGGTPVTPVDSGGQASGGYGQQEIEPLQPQQPITNIYIEGNLVDMTDLAREMRSYNIELGEDVY